MVDVTTKTIKVVSIENWKATITKNDDKVEKIYFQFTELKNGGTMSFFVDNKVSLKQLINFLQEVENQI